MPPKIPAKSKGPAACVQFAYTQRVAPPAPAPLPPHRRSDTVKCVLTITDASGAPVLVGLLSVDSKLRAVRLRQRESQPLADEPQQMGFSNSIGVDLDSVVVTKISGSDGASAALVATERHGLLVVGCLRDECVSGSIQSDGVLLRWASSLPGAAITPGSKALNVACSTRHGVALVSDLGSGSTKALGYGFTDMHALGVPPPLMTTLHATDGLGKVPRPKMSLHEGPLPTPFYSFASLPQLASLTPTAVFCSRNMTFFSCPSGLYALGALSQRCSMSSPRLVLAVPHVQVVSVVVLNSSVYALTRGNRVWRMGVYGSSRSPCAYDDDDADDPRPTTDADGYPVFVDVTEQLFGGCLGDEESLLQPNAQLSRMIGGAEHCIAVDSVHGRVYGWGSNSFGQLGHPPHLLLTAAHAVEVPLDGALFSSVHALGYTTLVLDAELLIAKRFGR